jgi:glutamine amidotransferase
MEESEEDGGTKTLGLIPGKVHRFPDPLIWNNEVLKVPHMGWNSVQWLRKHPVINGLDPDFEYYFVHSYYPKPAKEDFILGYTFYGINFPSAIIYENLIAFQFHPEKSGRPGLLILKNFCEWKP